MSESRANLTEAEGRIFFRGLLEDSSMVIDVLSFLFSSRRSGAINLVCGEVRKSVYMRDGSVIAARSNQPEDRFGNVMFRMGLIGRRALDEALRAVRPGVKIGNVLLSRGLLNSKDLWNVIRTQIEEIVYSTVLIESGEFTVAHFDPTQVPTRTALATQQLLMEGVRRKDEMNQMRRELPSSKLPLAPSSPLPSVTLNECERRVFDLVNGSRTLTQICRDSGLGDFEATRILHHLVNIGVVQEGRSRADTVTRLAGGDIGDAIMARVVRRYNRALSRVHKELRAHDRGRLFSTAPQSFFRDLSNDSAPLFEDVVPETNGEIPLEPILASLGRFPDGDRLGVLRRGLDEYLEFMLFLARETLEFHQVERLAMEVDSDLGRLPG